VHLLNRLRPTWRGHSHNAEIIAHWGRRWAVAGWRRGLRPRHPAAGAGRSDLRATTSARRLLRRWFALRARAGRQLPEVLAPGCGKPRCRRAVATRRATTGLSCCPAAIGGWWRTFQARRAAAVTLRKTRLEHRVPAKRAGLSRRETDVLAWLAAGRSNREIATLLDLSPHTVRHVIERSTPSWACAAALRPRVALRAGSVDTRK